MARSRWSKQTREKCGWNSEKLREERRAELVSIFKYFIPPTNQRTSRRKNCSYQNVCKKNGCRRVLHARHVCLTLRARRQCWRQLPKLTNHMDWYTEELVYRNMVLKTMLTSILSCLSPALLRFLRNFSRSAFPAILQPGTGWMQVCPREIYPWLQVFCFGHGWWIGPEHSVYIYHWLIVSCIDARWRPIRFRKGFYTLQICEWA